MARAHVSRWRRALSLAMLLLSAGALVGAPAWGQVPVGRLQPFLEATPRSTWMRGARFSVQRFSAGFHGAPGVAALDRVADLDAPAWTLEHPNATWSPPLHLLMDRARPALALPRALAAGAGHGQGAVIGIVDAGVDITHPDLQNPDGTTRVAWWIDFASNPAGIHPDLEAAYGCTARAGARCQILAASDLNALLQNGIVGDEPRDPIGHGTHVTSIAAGNGRARSDAAFAGVAPEATLIVARVTSATGDIANSDVALATQFVFDRAAELGLPAVVNLSLGADFGAHDGSSSLSQLLDGYVGPSQPGHAIVVAAGNSGQLLRGVTQTFQEPLGIHTEVRVSDTTGQRLPLLTPYPPGGADVTHASVFVWLNLYAAQNLSIGLELPDGSVLAPIAAGQSEIGHGGDVVAMILHGLGDPTEADQIQSTLGDVGSADLLPSDGSAVILIDGSWPAGSTFGIDLMGHGRAELWAQSEGDLAPQTGSPGAIFPSARAERTVTIPASDPALLAVGASINRLDWTDAHGDQVQVDTTRLAGPLSVGEAAFFSSAGPNRGGDFKPELLAPGGFVIADLASDADPRHGGAGVFSGLCQPLGCQVVSDQYALTAGTSMAAPMVSGAVALLLERDPSLTQEGVRALLLAGSDAATSGADPASREGGGALNLGRSFEASSAGGADSLAQPDLAQSRLRFAGSFVVPDGTRSLAALAWLRDAAGAVFDAGLERVSASVRGGSLAAPLERIGPGLYGLRVSAPTDARDAVLKLELQVDGKALLSAALPVDGVSPQTNSGGCTLALRRSPFAPSGGALAAGALYCMALGIRAGRRRLIARRDIR
jgi:subtilisin family serine protease